MSEVKPVIPESPWPKDFTKSVESYVALEKRLEDAKAALRFYADIENWETSDRNGYNRAAIKVEDQEWFRDQEEFCGGMKARAYFERYKDI